MEQTSSGSGKFKRSMGFYSFYTMVVNTSGNSNPIKRRLTELSAHFLEEPKDVNKVKLIVQVY